MFRSILMAALVALLPQAVLAEAKTYALDNDHTEIRFVWDHAGVSDQGGRWSSVEGTVSFDPKDLAATSVSVKIDPASINTGVPALDKHMKTSDMFDIEAFPDITFTSKGAVQTGNASARVTGDLTIKDATLPMVLDVELVHMGEHPLGQFLDFYKGEWIGIRATGRLLRSAYGVGFGAPLTSDLIRVEISSEMKAQ